MNEKCIVQLNILQRKDVLKHHNLEKKIKSSTSIIFVNLICLLINVLITYKK